MNQKNQRGKQSIETYQKILNFILIIIGKKEEKKNDNKGIKEIKKFLLEYYILNLENIIRKMNKMILEIFMNKTRVRCLDFFLFFFLINIKYEPLAGIKLTN